MSQKRKDTDLIMSGNTLIDFEYNDALGTDTSKWLSYLRENPDIALQLLETENRDIIYMGSNARGMGMRFVSRNDFSTFEGRNTYGKFLMGLRDALRMELASSSAPVEPVPDGTVVVDFTPGGREGVETYVQGLFRDGEDFIHTDPIGFVSRQRAMDMDDPDAVRMAEEGDGVHTYVNPFGTESRSRVRVDSAAEASLLYERGIRGELDVRGTLQSLVDRGNIRQMSNDSFGALVKDITNQFDWIRTNIRTEEDLPGRRVVADDLLVPDYSFGRSVYHPVFAPSAAHILAYYIQNPLLLDNHASECITARALERSEHEEPMVIASVERLSGRRVVIVLDGSDTIGGRVPNTSGFTRKDKRTRKDVTSFIFKSQDEINADYEAFSSRLKETLKRIDKDMEIMLVVDGDRKRGIPSMAHRFVEENKGMSYVYSFQEKAAVLSDKDKNRKDTPRFSVVDMPKFDWVQPVLAGGLDEVRIPVDGLYEGGDIVFGAADFRPDAVISWSDFSDRRAATFTRRTSVAVASGMPVVHVMNNLSLKEQKALLEDGVTSSRLSLLGGVRYSKSLFTRKTLRSEWDLSRSAVLSSVRTGMGGAMTVASSIVDSVMDNPVYVEGVPFHTVYGAFRAYLAQEVAGAGTGRLREIAAADAQGLMTSVDAAYASVVGKSAKATDRVVEKCLRNAVHQMARSDSSFRDRLLGVQQQDIVIALPGGDTTLFTDLDGKGENRFGVVLAAERDLVRADLEIIRQRAAEEARRVADEQARERKRQHTRRAEGQKMLAGFPDSIEASKDAVWVGGTARPGQLVDSGRESFAFWDNDGNQSPLVRAVAESPSLEVGKDEFILNDFVFLSPTNAMTASGRESVRNFPNLRDLTGLSRVDPATGERFTCAFSVPVKRNKDKYEAGNDFGMPSSFYANSDAGIVRSGFIRAFTEARNAALDHGMAVCAERNTGAGGEGEPFLASVFGKEAWARVRKTRQKYNRGTRKYEDETYMAWSRVENPHRADSLAAIANRGIDMLVEGSEMPLNFFTLPKAQYAGQSGPGTDIPFPDEVFVADLAFMVDSANALAVRRGVPLRFALDADGRIDLGPGLTEHQRSIAEKYIDAYIGVVNGEDLAASASMNLVRIGHYDLYRETRRAPLENVSIPVMFRPNDLMAAFGRYDFMNILGGGRDVLHKMNFRDDDGNVYEIVDPRLSSKFSQADLNAVVTYEKNAETRFSVRSSNPDMIPAFISAVRQCVEIAQRSQVEYRLVTPRELEDWKTRYEPERDDEVGVSMEGYIDILSSNSLRDVTDAEVEFSARDKSSTVANRSTLEKDEKEEEGYWGHVDAGDGFAGYVQYRVTRPGEKPEEGAWKVILNRELARDVAMTVMNREYRTDEYKVPSVSVAKDLLRAEHFSGYNVLGYGSLLGGEARREAPVIKTDSKVFGQKADPAQAEEKSSGKSEGKGDRKGGFTMNVNNFLKK